MKKLVIVLAVCFYWITLPCHAGLDEGIAALNKQDYTAALREFMPLAKQGNASAQFNLGVMYDNGQGVPQDYKEAVRWYRLAADQGNASAQSNLGVGYANGQGVPQDYKEAVRWYRLAADQGHASAQSNLGVMYDNGQGVPQDYKEAVRWYRLAADQGHASAQFNLGVRYDNGQGVPQDYKEAVRWYRLAADQGGASAQFNLGVRYANGQGVPESKVIAYALYNLSAANDPSSDNKATNNRTGLIENMTVPETEAAQNLTREMAKSGNLLKALDQYMKRPAVREKHPKAATNKSAQPVTSSDNYPARPAKIPGVVSCNTKCSNADCLRTYDDGRKVRFQAKQKWDPFENTFKFDSGSC
jgi:TPR repeat protein